jgi:NitT/TauT family transport system ATP-binding protein
MLAPVNDPRPIAPVFEAQSLTIDYETDKGAVRAVENVSLAASEGERLVLLGRSGCGKSTILKAVAGFVKPSSGLIKVRGRLVAGPGPDRIVVFQEFDQLLPWKTVRQNVEFPLQVFGRLSAGEKRERSESALRRVGLERALDSYPHTLSGGMKQRAAIARALVTDADVLLMDEPFAALDALTRRQLQADLLQLADEIGLTLLFVTHSIEEAILIGTRLHLLSAHPGRTVTEFDTAHFGWDDMAAPAFERMVKDVESILFARTEAPARKLEHV